MTDPTQLLDVPMQHIGQQITRSELNRIPAQSLADLRHRDTQQRAGIALAHLADFVTILIPVNSSWKTCSRSSCFAECPEGLGKTHYHG